MIKHQNSKAERASSSLQTKKESKAKVIAAPLPCRVYPRMPKYLLESCGQSECHAYEQYNPTPIPRTQCEKSQGKHKQSAAEEYVRLDYSPFLPLRPKFSDTSGCTTRICRVSASLRENVFSSRHKWQRTFCLRLLWIVSSWRVKSYGRENSMLQGLPVEGLMRAHL